MLNLIILFITIIGCSITTNSQIDIQNPTWEIGCDTLTTQTEMNICSYKKYILADSVLNYRYETLINYLDNEYQKEIKQFSDSTNEIHKDFIQNIINQKEIIIKSKDLFKEFLKHTIKVMDYQYKGGSMSSLVVNTYALEITINQIHILDEMIEEIINNDNLYIDK